MKKKQKILIVEDERALLMVLADKFQREGFMVFRAQNGQEGLDQAIRAKPDLIILDIIMPSMDGLTMLKKIREDKHCQSIPVLMLSNLSDPDQINESTGRGRVEFLVKSNWSLGDVVQKAKQTLKN